MSVSLSKVTEREGITAGSIQQFSPHLPDCLLGYSPPTLWKRRHVRRLAPLLLNSIEEDQETVKHEAGI